MSVPVTPLTKGQTFDSDDRMFALAGCGWKEARDLNLGLPLGDRNGYYKKYMSQRRDAATRGVGWEISLPEWIALWVDSGKWELRGRGKGRYCMARFGDEGPYKVGNVSIQLAETNSRDGIKRADFTSAIRHRTGSGRGWTYVAKGAKHYQVVVAKKYIGTFATQEEAEAAYRDAADIHKEDLFKHVAMVASNAELQHIHLRTERI